MRFLKRVPVPLEDSIVNNRAAGTGRNDTVKQRSRLRDQSVVSHDHELPHRSCEEKPKVLPWRKIHWQRYTRSGNPAILFWTAATLIAILTFSKTASPAGTLLDNTGGGDTAKDLRIVFPRALGGPLTWGPFPHPPMLPKKARGHANFGGLDFDSRKRSKDGGIAIPATDYRDAERKRRKFLEEMNTDDDKYQPISSKEDQDPSCRFSSWTGYSFPSCNQIHEKLIERVGDEGYTVSYLNSGSYRDAFRFRRQTPADHFVLKRIIFDDLEVPDMADIMKEALILERLSPSPRVIDIYGYCGTTVILEAMASDLHTKIIIDEGAFSKEGVISQKKLDKLQEDDVYPLNNFTTSEKLQISLDMAESLADIHGFEGGPIIHADTHIEQWLIAPDGRIKFNDFNNARLPSWDAKEKKYCERTSYYGGTWRSPEEYIPSPQDESIDVYAYGNNIYTLLTGLWPYYDEYSHEISESDIKRQIVAGKRPFVDPRYRTRSVIEKGLVKIMEKCWAQEREDRPTSYELVKYMRRLKAEAVHVGELKESSLIKIPIPRGLR